MAFIDVIFSASHCAHGHAVILAAQLEIDLKVLLDVAKVALDEQGTLECQIVFAGCVRGSRRSYPNSNQIPRDSPLQQ